jgi:sodium transport system ATP-binding protein
VIRVENLWKSFGRYSAVAGATFGAPDGSITGLVGPNGSGKTTTLRMVTGLVCPDQGRVLVDGESPVTDSLVVRRRIGVLTDSLGNYPRLTGREHLRYFGELQSVNAADLELRIESLIKLFEMGNIADRPAWGLSQGERMKVALARALVHDPSNLLLDEPTNGLDVHSARALRALLLRLRDAGKCLVLSSHIMQEVAAVCDRLVVLARGRVLAEGAPAELLRTTGAASLEDAFIALTHSGEVTA